MPKEFSLYHLNSWVLLLLGPIIFFKPRYATIVFIVFSLVNLAITLKSNKSFIKEFLARINSPTISNKIYNFFFIINEISSIWRPYKNWFLEIKLLLITLPGMWWWLLSQKIAHQQMLIYRQFLFITWMLLCGSIWIEYFFDQPVVKWLSTTNASHFAIPAMTLSLLVWIMPSSKRVVVFPVTLITLVKAFDCDTATFGLLIGLIAVFFSWIERKWFWRMLQVSFVLFTLILPFSINSFLTIGNIENITRHIPVFSYVHRLYIMKFTSEYIAKKPWVGYGITASRQPDIGKDNFSFTFPSTGTSQQLYTFKKIPLHPHNMVLQWWLEWGIMGAIFWSSIVCKIIEYIRLLPIEKRWKANGFFFSNLSIILFSIDFWQTWWWTTWMLLAPFVFDKHQKEER